MLKPKAEKPKPNWADLRLTDKIAPGVRVLLIGINPGVLSASTGHHFAGPTNRFWPLLYESGLVPVPVTHDDDVRLPEWGLGITNLVARPTPGIDTLKPGEYLEGWKILEAKIAKYRPEIVAFVGVTMYRALWKVIGHAQAPDVQPGFQKATVHGARLFVLPNPSGRNAHFGYAEMLESFRALRRAMKKLPATGVNGPPPAPFRSSDASSAAPAAAARGKLSRGSGTTGRTPPYTPAAGRSRRAPRRRAGSRS
jgi:TDG/mug DNA glycosylase family protein